MPRRSTIPMRLAARLLAALVPELALLTCMFTLMRDRVRAGGASERGDTIQWVIIFTIGAAMALAVGTLIYQKVTAKAAQINLNTP
ncbi:MAG: hypothetical protein ACYCO3_07650 [Mycobacteriales bacterium]